jgi:hypothetical protein
MVLAQVILVYVKFYLTVLKMNGDAQISHVLKRKLITELLIAQPYNFAQ